MRRTFSAKRTSVHSALTMCSPLKLNCPNPSTCLIQSLGGSAFHLRRRLATSPSSVRTWLPSPRRAVNACSEAQCLLAFSVHSYHQVTSTVGQGIGHRIRLVVGVASSCRSTCPGCPSPPAACRECPSVAGVVGPFRIATMVCACSSTAGCSLAGITDLLRLAS